MNELKYIKKCDAQNILRWLVFFFFFFISCFAILEVDLLTYNVFSKQQSTKTIVLFFQDWS